MKTGRIFWGVLFVAAGVLLLLERMDIFYVEWSWMWKFWPLLLVVWGVVILLGNKQPGKAIVVGLLAIGVALFVFSTFNFGWNWNWQSHDWQANAAEYDQELVQPFDSTVNHASFTLQSGAGAFTIEDTTTQLMEASTHSSLGRYVCDLDKGGNAQRVTLALEGHEHHWSGGRIRNNARIRLNSAPVWNIKFELGASSMEADLTRYAVERLVVEAGAANIKLTLGDKADESRVSVQTGVSQLHVSIPDSVGCEIRAEAPLSHKDFRGFTKIHSGVYQTDNFETAKKRIYLDLHAGVSNLSVKRYSL
jgi:hypothetical protein